MRSKPIGADHCAIELNPRTAPHTWVRDIVVIDEQLQAAVSCK